MRQAKTTIDKIETILSYLKTTIEPFQKSAKPARSSAMARHPRTRAAEGLLAGQSRDAWPQRWRVHILVGAMLALGGIFRGTLTGAR